MAKKNENSGKILKILSLAVAVTGIMHILFQQRCKKKINNSNNINYNPSIVEKEFEKFIIKKKNEGLPYDKAKILEQIARMESRHFKSELLYRTNNIGAITSQSPKPDTLTLYVKPVYKNGVFVGNVITDENDKDAEPYHYRCYKTLDEGLEAFYDVVVANNYDYKKYSGDQNASLKGIKSPIVDKIYGI